ncbi:hypothetical protein ARTHRO9AX_190149 [Arthrobacter sp. 9AX]|nr:hypothetical protein ARTHRO9AX_190149 [Arthrobacter sp. 9AX]
MISWQFCFTPQVLAMVLSLYDWG